MDLASDAAAQDPRIPSLRPSFERVAISGRLPERSAIGASRSTFKPSPDKSSFGYWRESTFSQAEQEFSSVALSAKLAADGLKAAMGKGA